MSAIYAFSQFKNLINLAVLYYLWLILDQFPTFSDKKQIIFINGFVKNVYKKRSYIHLIQF